MRWLALGICMICLATFVLGCRDSGAAVEGKVNITSTNAFSKNKAIKSPPPQKPGQ